jgi:hypothetical protein
MSCIKEFTMEESKNKIVTKDYEGKIKEIWEKLIEKYGTPLISSRDGKLKRTPIFFTGRLSGQRALDLGSRKRLLWHVKKILGQKIP